ncbi:unnamed protein product [Oreochromis niloticus]|nr:unnamed protein product [Mustela putorius furo]
MDCNLGTGSSLPPPVLTVFPPCSAELQSNTASLVCLSSQSVKFADVSWLAGGSPVSSGISTSTAVQRPDQTYQISSSLTIQTSDWNMDKIPGGVPQFVLRFRYDSSSPTYGSGFSAPKFTSTHQSRSDYRLIIKNVEEGDSAVYYCVSGVTVVTQKPVLSVSKGETATMDCNLGTVTDVAVFWYKQIPGGVPQFVLWFIHDHSSPNYGSGFSSPKFTSTHQSRSDYRLIIKNVEEGDSAVYYCKTWDNSVISSVSL